jgi:4-amino-4-deoxy-L-arabinose transferase-like glycosyltransferase
LQPLINSKRLWLLLSVAVGVVYFYGAGGMPLLGPDEPRYAQVAREMFERGDLVTPTLGGLTWFEKPALLYWLMMAGYGLFGVSEWAARLPSAVAGVLTIGAVAWLARRVEREAGESLRHFAIIATSIAASSLGLIVFAHGASFDIIIVAAIAWTLAFFFAADEAKDAGERRRMLCGMYVGVGFGLLAKGLVGVVIPAFIVALYFLIQRRLPARSMWLSLVWGTLIAAFVAGVWYVPVMREHGWAFVDEFFVQHHFARYTSNKYRHPQRFYFYLPITLLLALPWTLCLVAALAQVRRWIGACLMRAIVCASLRWCGSLRRCCSFPRPGRSCRVTCCPRCPARHCLSASG